MGDNYSVCLDIKFREGKRDEARDSLRKWMEKKESRYGPKGSFGNVCWCREECRKNGIDTDTLEGMIKCILAFHQGSCRYDNECDGGWETYRSEFRGSYSWSSVMEDAMSELAPYLEDGSSMSVGRDDGYDEYLVESEKYEDGTRRSMLSVTTRRRIWEGE